MSKEQKLTKFAEEQLGHYVYALRNPIDNKIFYVGKGQGDRVLAHANDVLKNPDSEDSLKRQTIKAIHDSGREVESFIVQHGLLSEDHALMTESAIYGTLKLLQDKLDHPLFALTNKVAPPSFNKRGLRSLAEVLDEFGQPADSSLIPHNSLLVKVTKTGTWTRGMTRDQVWDSIRGWWPLDRERLKNIRYLIAIPDFVIRGVWEVKPSDWRIQTNGDRGWDDILKKRSLGKERKPRWGLDFGTDVSMTRFSSLLSTSIERHFIGQERRANFQYLDDQKVKHLKTKEEETKRTPFWNVNLT